ncbi:MAG: SoxR reducing system RseC family protein [Alphaproteobacteria bacterium]|nr:SoxR reducing system RseC family protein [Alphaproteobacteria bacterium]
MSESGNIIATGRVMRDRKGRTWVGVPRRSACKSCGQGDRCGMSVLGGLGGDQTLRLPLDGVDYQVGDVVNVSCPRDGLLAAAMLAYGRPALGLMGGAVCAVAFQVKDEYQALGALTGLILGLMITRWAAARAGLPNMNVAKE